MSVRGSGLYARLPVWAQNVALTAFGAVLARERYGGRSRELREWLASSEWASRADLEQYQDEQLRRIVHHAYHHVPYYRRVFDEHRLTPGEIRGRADLPKLPLLTRDDVKRHFDELRSRDVAPRSLRTGHTSGTTGTPLTVAYDRQTIWFTYAVFDRHYRWAGCRMGFSGDRVAVARGNVIVPLGQTHPPFWRYNRWQNQLLLSSFHLSKANLPAYVEALRAFRPVVLDGYPSTLYVLAKYLEGRGETLPLRAAVTSSETLYDFQRAVIEERFACRVFDYYALAERVVFASECSHHAGRHVAMEYGLAEIVTPQGDPAPDGVVGRLVGTSLHNRAMPLIRYVTNDMTAVRADACVCGRHLERIDEVTTKAEDLLTLGDGRLISPSVLTHPFKPLDCIEGSQIVQEAPDHVVVRIVPGKTYTPAHTRVLVSGLSERLGERVRIEVVMVDRLERAASGKFKWVISRVPLGI
jgi:phenylacetate-CoA ligase